MKIKRKPQIFNGVKSSIANNEPKSDDKSDSKSDPTKIETVKTDLTSNNLNELSDKDKMKINTVNRTSNGSYTNGLTADNELKNKLNNNLVNSKNLSFKEKKKLINNGFNNSLKDNNDKSQIKDGSNSCEKEETKNNLSNNNKCTLNVNKNLSISSTNSNNKNSTIVTNKPKENSDLLSENDSVLNSKSPKRELNSDLTSLNKKIKIDNNKNIEKKDESTNNASTMTEPDCLGFAEPGTSIVLEGAVLDEIEGVLVVNVTWRGKTYVGTLLDCTKHDWAPPRFCDSPTSDLELRGGFMRNVKRSRGSISESENNIKLQQSKLRNGKGRRNFTVPSSPKQDQQSINNNLSNSKRSNSKSDNTAKQQRSTPPLNSNSANNTSNSIINTQSNQTRNQQSSLVLIECPEPNCNKKYKHINGLKYHQTHAHHDTNNTNSSKSINNAVANKDGEETTDTEDCVEDSETSLLTNKGKKLINNKSGKGNDEDKNRSPYSDISDDTENESRPSSNNSAQTSQSTTNAILNNDEKTEKILNDVEVQSDSITNKDNDQKTNEELKLASEVDQKMTEQQSNINVENLLSNSTVETNQPTSISTSNNNLISPKTNNFTIPPNFSIDPNLHAYLMQIDLNYRLSYERYFNEHQEKLLSQFTANELNSISELEKERHKSFSLANQNILNNNISKDNSIFKLPTSNHLPTSLTPRPSSSKTNDRPPSSNSLTSVGGGSIVNGTSNISQNNIQTNKQNLPSPYDFLEFEQFGKQREEMFRLNSNSKTTLPHNSSPQHQRQNPSPSKKMSLKDVQQTSTNQLSKVNKSEDNTKSTQQINGLSPNFFNFPSPFNQMNPSLTNQHLPIISTNFSPTTTSIHQSLPFDRNLFRSGQSPFYNPSLIDSFRFANSGLSTIDLNNSFNASKLPINNQQSAQLLNNKQELNMIFPKSAVTTSNGSQQRTLTANLSQNSSSVLNTNNNINVSTSDKKDENRSPPLRLNSQHVGVGFPAPFIMDPYGELIQQAAASTLIPFATK